MRPLRVPLVFVHGLAALCTLAMLALACRELSADSPTEDEWAHTIRGITYWQQGDTRLSFAHPPLANLLAGLAAHRDGEPDVTAARAWKESDPGRVALDYMKRDYPSARAQLMSARHFHVALCVVLCSYVYLWMLHVFGVVPALAALALVAFNPTLIGQSRYVATDFPLAVVALIATGELIRFVRGGRWALPSSVLALALCAMTKHSGAPLLCLLLLVACVAGGAGVGRYAGVVWWKRLSRVAGYCVLAGCVTLFAINAVYRFQDTGLTVAQILKKPEPQYQVSRGARQKLMERHSFVARLPKQLRVPLPYTYLFGLACVKAMNKQGFETYFMGEVYWHGKPWYFPVMLAIKNPPALLLLLLAGALAWALRRPFAWPDVATRLLLGVMALVMLALISAGLNMGMRHGLFAVPIMSLLGGIAFAQLWQRTGQAAVHAVLMLLLVSPLLEAAAIAPRYLGYFNLFAGGEAGGHRISAFGEDWGQDRAAFVALAKARKLEPIYYDTQTPTRALELDYLGLDYETLRCKVRPPRGALAAIHRLSLTRGIRCFPWTKGIEPELNFREHVLVYRVP